MPDKPILPPPGLSRPTTTPVPDEIFDVWLPHLSEAELKVLLYICRRTLGFKKDTDPIALSQLTHGIVRKDGRRLDSGSGVSESSVVRAVKGLLAKGLIIKDNQTNANGGHDTTYYGLNWHGLAPSLHDERRVAEGTVNLTPPLLAPQKEQQTDVTINKNGSDENLRAALQADLRARCKRYGVLMYGEKYMLDAWLATPDRDAFSEQINRFLPTAYSLSGVAFDMGIRERRE